MHEISHNAQQSRALKITAHIARTFMGVVFIASGFVKAIDPWGTIIKVEEYMQIYGVEWLRPLSVVLSIWLCGAEMMMGCMLTFKVRIRFVSIFALLSMAIFTVVAFLSATVLPVEDCGCFGEALKLTPWQTFFKNLALLPMALIVYLRYRPDKIFLFKRVEILLATIFFSVAMGIPTYCYLHLPLIDYMPYKVGVNLLEAIAQAKSAMNDDTEVILVYRKRSNGKIRRFSLDDKAWHDDQKWEWVETITVSDEPDVKTLVGEFAILCIDGEEVTSEILATPGDLHIIFISDSQSLEGRCRENIERFIASAEGRVVVVTPDYIDKSGLFLGVECYNIDPITMKTALRANYGVISLRDGVIVDKRNCRDM